MAELAPRPAHVPPERVVDFDLYAPPGVERDFHRAWASLLAPHLPALVWTPHNEGHWIATRASLVRAVLSDHRRFSSRTIIIPKSHGDAHGLLPTTVDPP
ncbi:MAG: hypothetical protein KatS3mg124_1699 [Porticoccaceae bacterium]|nr:MAG: hypothetical protein KatS3mg124_1699 [Porticoccaceae bacterium]